MTENTIIFKRPALLVLGILAALSLSRLMLIGLNWERVTATGGVAFVLLQGARFDLILAGLLFTLVFLLLPWLHKPGRVRSAGRSILALYMALVTALAFFVEASTASFVAEFDTRPNILFLEYLSHPKEVLATLMGAYLIQLLAFSGMAILLVWHTFRWLRRDPAAKRQVPLSFSLLATPVILVLGFFMIRSTLDHHPVNPSVAAFSQDGMVNQLPLNSPYSLLYAVYEQSRDGRDKGVRYGAMEDQEVLKVILEEAGIGPGDQLDAQVPTLHHQVATQPKEKPLNLVLIVEESLGAEFVGSLGGRDLTPELDRLASEGIWLDQLYATGTRSVRGLEAIVTGFTPTPRRSVVKLSETQNQFFTMATLLQSQGFTTSFMYGGSAHFDNMKRFFLNNGFQTVIEQRDFDDPEFVGPWGVSDEDLFNRAHEEFSRAGDQPFFSLVFTTTHHKPFDIPPGRVSVIEGPEGRRETAVKYADYALGRYMAMARQSNYWENTVFLITADHNSRVYGDQLVPVDRFRIPGLIMGGSIDPRRIPGVSSHIDLLPTLLSLAGVSGDHPAIGRDLTRTEFAAGAGRAIMQFHAMQAYMEGEQLIVLQPGLDPLAFQRQSAHDMVQLPVADPALVRKALAYAHWGPMVIANHAYFINTPQDPVHRTLTP